MSLGPGSPGKIRRSRALGEPGRHAPVRGGTTVGLPGRDGDAPQARV